MNYNILYNLYMFYNQFNYRWYLYPHEVNANYVATMNRIYVPAGILQAPYFTNNNKK